MASVLTCSCVRVCDYAEQIVVAVDFRNAYDSVSFDFLDTALRYIGLPGPYVAVLMSVMKGPILFCVGRSFVCVCVSDVTHQIWSTLVCVVRAVERT